MSKMTFRPADSLVDDVWGKRGTPDRDAMETRLKEEADAYFIGEAIKSARLQQHLTQEELGERIGVKRAQICKLENGSKVFRALGISSAILDLGTAGKVVLW